MREKLERLDETPETIAAKKAEKDKALKVKKSFQMITRKQIRKMKFVKSIDDKMHEQPPNMYQNYKEKMNELDSKYQKLRYKTQYNEM